MLGTLSNPNIKKLRQAALPLTGASGDYDLLLESIGDLNYVLLGEATHGTHEFYKARAEITKRLIKERASRRLRSKQTGQTRLGSIDTCEVLATSETQIKR